MWALCNRSIKSWGLSTLHSLDCGDGGPARPFRSSCSLELSDKSSVRFGIAHGAGTEIAGRDQRVAGAPGVRQPPERALSAC